MHDSVIAFSRCESKDRKELIKIHYVSVIQDSRTDGSIISEVKPSPSEKSTHGGWGSIDRNNETLGYHALSAILIDSQGYDVNSISINGVNLEKQNNPPQKTEVINSKK